MRSFGIYFIGQRSGFSSVFWGYITRFVRWCNLMILVFSPRFAEHVPPPGHPERPERAQIFETVATRSVSPSVKLVEPRAATREELERVHDVEHVDQITKTSGLATMLDADTFTSPATYDVARLAAGATVQAAEHAVTNREPAFALVRPPGHHAERDRAMGFCFFNNAAVAAAAMLARGLERIAIVDIDVHHGNGTQSIFYNEPRVLYVSTHQYPFYPGTGAAGEVGDGAGKGFTVNVPMEAGSIDADYALVHRAVVNPILDQFKPQLLLVSAGYDAHERDPLASMRMTTNGYGAIVGSLAQSAARHGALALVSEGGYDLGALAACVEASCAAIEGRAYEVNASDSVRGERAVAAVRSAQKPFWRGL
jgi:acetoin utilization deacetylase AcuC-like enzyme